MTGRGHEAFCKPCSKSYHFDNYTSKLRSGSLIHIAGYVLNSMKDRTKKKGFIEDVEWTVEEVAEELQKGVCSATGFPYRMGTSGDCSKKNPFQPSPDRIDNSKGYSKENTRFVVYIFNAMRSNFDDEDLSDFIKHLKGNEDVGRLIVPYGRHGLPTSSQQ